jgi:hypothetical protein
MRHSAPEPSPVPGNSKAARLKRLRSLSYILDNAIPIPGTSYRVGLDPILGLIPGGGDILGSAFSAYIVLEAALLGLPRESLVRMASNILFETVVGSVPVLGDIFDVTWKANVKNMALLEAHMNSPKQSQRADWWFIILLLGGLMLVVLGIAAISIIILRLLFQAIGG